MFVWTSLLERCEVIRYCVNREVVGHICVECGGHVYLEAVRYARTQVQCQREGCRSCVRPNEDVVDHLWVE